MLDASAALALVLAEAEGEEVRALVATAVSSNGQLHVPELFWYEVGNGLRSAEVSGRLSAHEVGTAEEALRDLPFVCSTAADGETARTITSLARQHALTFYDASYLQLAIRINAPLKTFDTDLLELRSAYDVIL